MPFSRLLLTFLLLTFTACKEPAPSFVFLENTTADKLQVIAEFDEADTASEPLIFELEPGQQDGWRFISDKKKAESFGSSFHSLLIRSERCERKIERSTLAKQVRKDGEHWGRVLHLTSDIYRERTIDPIIIGWTRE